MANRVCICDWVYVHCRAMGLHTLWLVVLLVAVVTLSSNCALALPAGAIATGQVNNDVLKPAGFFGSFFGRFLKKMAIKAVFKKAMKSKVGRKVKDWILGKVRKW